MHLGQQHLHARRRLFKNLEQFPARGAWKRLLDYVMYGVGVLQPLALIPQLYEIYINHQVQGISVYTFFLFGMFNILWALYGAAHKERPILISGTLFVFLYAAIVVGVLLY
jgi:uncharacterized protein with PQ loop repeat